MKVHLATFYSLDLKRSANRFRQQVEEMGIYDYVHIFNQNDLNDDFKNYISQLLKKGKKKRIWSLGVANIYSSVSIVKNG